MGGSVSGTPEGLRESMKKATTEMLILFLLRHKKMYTYEMMATIDDLSGGRVTFNTIYQAIYRLQGFAYVEESGKELSESNRMRIYYSITDSGREYYKGLVQQFRNYVSAVEDILAQDGNLDLD